jgi:hypothetical protein
MEKPDIKQDAEMMDKVALADLTKTQRLFVYTVQKLEGVSRHYFIAAEKLQEIRDVRAKRSKQ